MAVKSLWLLKVQRLGFQFSDKSLHAKEFVV